MSDEPFSRKRMLILRLSKQRFKEKDVLMFEHSSNVTLFFKIIHVTYRFASHQNYHEFILVWIQIKSEIFV